MKRSKTSSSSSSNNNKMPSSSFAASPTSNKISSTASTVSSASSASVSTSSTASATTSATKVSSPPIMMASKKKSPSASTPPSSDPLTMLKSLDSLQEDLDIQTMRFMEFTRKEQQEIFLHKVKELAATEIVENSMQVGERILNFHATDRHGHIVRSSKLLAQGPLVITFFRGDWCTYCNLTLRLLQRALPEIQAKGASLIAVTPQSHRKLTQNDSPEQAGYDFPILCDESNAIAKQFRIAYNLDPVIRKLYFEWGIDVSAVNEDGSNTLPLAATYVIDRRGTVVYSYVDCAPSERAEPAEILNAIPDPPASKKRIRYVLRSKLRQLVSGITGGDHHGGKSKK